MPQLSAICCIGAAKRVQDDVDADLLVALGAADGPSRPPRRQRSRATPPPGRMPSSTAARVACRASSTRAFFCFMSASVLAPTEITATPPVSLASRSWNFSRSYSLSVSSIWLRICSMRALDVGRLAGAFDDRGGVLVDRDLLGPAEVLEREVLELQAQVLADQRAAGQHGDVAQHGLAAIAEARRLDGTDVQHAAELVDHQAVRASPSTSSAMINSGLPVWLTFSSSGISSRRLLIFFSWIRM